jgi:anti-sigma-K factor RskA
MSSRDHTAYRDEIGAYLLRALTDPEREAFEQHLESCAQCRDEVEQLRPAAEALPRSVEQVDPPPSLRASLMDVVDSEARERSGAAAARRSLRERLLPGRLLRPALVGAALAVGLLAGFGVAQLGGDAGEEVRTFAATVDDQRLPTASGNVKLEGDGENGAILRLQGMPSLGGERVYQAWVQRDGSIVPQPTFEVGEDGGGAVALPDDLSDAQAVLVTREPRGGSRAPTEQPLLSVPL